MNQWNHIPGENNPADLPSRGCSVKYLIDSRWWEGPEWLKRSRDLWPVSEEVKYNGEEINNERKKASKILTETCLINKEDKSGIRWYSLYFSEYSKIIRLIAWVLRFINNCKLKVEKRSKGELTVQELEVAEVRLIKTVQSEMFSGFQDKILSSLEPIVDQDGLIRLKTKVSEKEDSFGFKFPIVLSPKHPISESIIMHYHKNNCHAGVQILLNLIRERFWILGGRRSIRSVVTKCVVCKRFKSKHLESSPAVLPPDRVRECSVFEVTGIDFAGPLYLKNNEKAWICLFTCANYRAVHLELVTSLATNSFIQAFRRFIARRGRPSVVYSDNATNFIGTSNLLKQIDWKKVERYSADQKIQWKFNPPTAAWWGGWWERLIRLLKDLLKRVLGKACLSYQEMITVLCDCETVMNSRPLTYVYDGISELEPLTPNHFLLEIRECGVPDFDRVEEVNFNKRLKYVQRLRQNLRQRFRREYLGQLVHKSNNKVQNKSPSVGDVVLIECDNMKRTNWPLGIIIETLPGKKGIVRVVKLRTAHGTLIRPIQKLYPLEVSASEVNELKKYDEHGSEEKETQEKSDQDDYRTRCGRAIKVPKLFTMFETELNVE